MKKLDNDFIKVYGTDGHVYYGGAQKWFEKKYVRNSGCGIIAAANLLLYLQGKREMTVDEYMDFAGKLKKRMVLVPGLGMNAVMLSALLNGSFKKLGIRKKAVPRITPIKFYGKIEKMIGSGIPVVMALGRDFPLIWRKDKVGLFMEAGEAKRHVKDVSAHFVTITGIDDEWLTISSWGLKLYISRKELSKFAWKRSSWMLTNIIDIV